MKRFTLILIILLSIIGSIYCDEWLAAGKTWVVPDDGAKGLKVHELRCLTGLYYDTSEDDYYYKGPSLDLVFDKTETSGISYIYAAQVTDSSGTTHITQSSTKGGSEAANGPKGFSITGNREVYCNLYIEILWKLYSKGSTKTVSFKSDNVKPTLNTPVKSTSSWTNGSVTVSATATDSGSGLNKIEYKVNNGSWVTGNSYTTSVQGTKVTFRAIDNVGNCCDDQTVTITNIDKTIPTITDPVKSINVWTTQDVAVSVSGADTGSGIKEYQHKVNEGEWINGPTYTAISSATVYFRALDKAGNCSLEKSIAVDNIDKEAPEVDSINVLPYEHGFRVSANFSDSGSGISASNCFFKVDNSSWNIGSSIDVQKGAVVSFYCKDNVGLQSETKSINVDKYQWPINNISNIYWGLEERQLECITELYAKDGVLYYSGNDLDLVLRKWETKYFNKYAIEVQDESDHIYITRNETVDYHEDIHEYNFTIYGDTILNCTAYNYSSVLFVGWKYKDIGSRTITFKNDNSLPKLSDPISNPMDWTRGCVEISIGATDEGSGVQTIFHKIGSEGWVAGATATVYENTNIEFYAIDNVGNESVHNNYAVTNIDKIAPILSNPTSNPSGWTNGVVNVSVTAADTGSGVQKVFYKKGSEDWVEGVTATVSNNTNVAFYAIDNLGNESVHLNYPVTTIDKVIPNICFYSSDNYQRNNLIITGINASDLLSGVNNDRWSISIDSGGWAPFSWSENKNFDISDLTDANHNFKLRVYDNAGNNQISNTTLFIKDAIAPIVAPISLNLGENRNAFNSFLSVHSPTATDNELGVGVNESTWQFRFNDSGNWNNLGEPVINLPEDSFSEGNHTFNIRVQDDLGNTGYNSIDFQIDRTLPDLSQSCLKIYYINDSGEKVYIEPTQYIGIQRLYVEIEGINDSVVFQYELLSTAITIE